MSDNLVFDKIKQTYDKFASITKPLNDFLGLTFGYTALFKDGSYYTIHPEIDCINQITSHIDKGILFCQKNLSSSKDNFTFLLWPENPTSKILEIFSSFNYKNLVSLIRENKNYLEIFFSLEIHIPVTEKFFSSEIKKFLMNILVILRTIAKTC